MLLFNKALLSTREALGSIQVAVKTISRAANMEYPRYLLGWEVE